jgi:hypothetical protein
MSTPVESLGRAATGRTAANRVALAALLAAGALAPAFPGARADSSIRCDGGIVSVGDSKLDLLGKCGPPALVDERPDKRWTASGRAVVAVEQWTYNFGPNQFLQFVTVVDGKVVGVERGGYGYPPEKLAGPPSSGRARCDSAGVRVGDSKLDLLAKCGEPALKESRLEKRVRGAGLVDVQIDVWTFDFGPMSFVLFATIEEGKVVQVERGGYGYAR